MVAAETQNPYLRDPDVQLMLRVKNGDDEAFSRIVDNYQNRLIGLMANLVGGDHTVAEDLAQEVFLRIHRARNGYEPTAKFRTWLFQIAQNLASNSRRTKGRHKQVQLKSEDSEAGGPRPEENMVPDKSGFTPSRQFAKQELQQKVREAMESLNDRQRLAVLLHKFEEMSYSDIGAIMEMTPDAVKSLLSRARDNLRTQLESFVH